MQHDAPHDWIAAVFAAITGAIAVVGHFLLASEPYLRVAALIISICVGIATYRYYRAKAKALTKEKDD